MIYYFGLINTTITITNTTTNITITNTTTTITITNTTTIDIYHI